MIAPLGRGILDLGLVIVDLNRTALGFDDNRPPLPKVQSLPLSMDMQHSPPVVS